MKIEDAELAMIAKLEEAKLLEDEIGGIISKTDYSFIDDVVDRVSRRVAIAKARLAEQERRAKARASRSQQ